MKLWRRRPRTPVEFPDWPASLPPAYRRCAEMMIAIDEGHPITFSPQPRSRARGRARPAQYRSRYRNTSRIPAISGHYSTSNVATSTCYKHHITALQLT